MKLLLSIGLLLGMMTSTFALDASKMCSLTTEPCEVHSPTKRSLPSVLLVIQTNSEQQDKCMCGGTPEACEESCKELSPNAQYVPMNLDVEI